MLQLNRQLSICYLQQKARDHSNQIWRSNLRNLLFENLDVATAAEIGDDIRQTLDQFEPITVTGLEVDANFDDNGFDVALEFEIIGRETFLSP